MADITPRLTSVKDRITELANLAGSDQAEKARQLAAELSAELDRAMEEASAPQVNASDRGRPLPKAPRHEVGRCPVCSLRTFHFEKGSVRANADAESGYEAFFRCLSCAYEGWVEID
ncbi:hypothetical protein [Halomonas sp. LBP4]|uniref:hypothetical protein n=1 Tax=Halomonas sp. LBP4 TaxID=2044917 RepID=UPI000D77372C|nr:hypothetical protein [Halomonas sp. LBP4]PXX98318.1 hypothetical protein CR157_08345 [Halomonas sp. LBP4]